MSFAEYENYDGLGLAQLVKQKEVSAEEVLECAIERAERLNPKINAISHKMYDQGRSALSNIGTGMFAGVPFLLKDLLANYSGEPTSAGSEALKQFRADSDSTLVQRYREAGLITFGKTTCPELGLMGVTESKAFGPTRNPWDLNKTPGGSSGGAASVVAAGILPLASGGDGGGSIRIPSACCGLFGLKPSRGRVPTGPDYGEVWEGAVQEHVLTRSVRDSAAILDCIHGPEASSPYRIEKPEETFLGALDKDFVPLKIGFTAQSPIGTKVDPAYQNYVSSAAKLLADMGHKVEEAKPDFDGDLLKNSYMTMYMGQVAADLNDMAIQLNTSIEKLKVEKTTKMLALLGHSISGYDYAKAKRDWHLFAKTMADYFSRFDVLMTPTLACPPVNIGQLEPSNIELIGMDVVHRLKAGKLLLKTGMLDEMASKSLSKVPFPFIANLTGLPAMSVPLYWDENNLPVGIHFVGQMAQEATLFQLASQLEKEQPWFERRPNL